jgi:hypothetical protein
MAMIQTWVARTLAISGILMFGGAVASAQSELRANVPFTFHTPNATMAPGEYEIRETGGRQPITVYKLTNLQSGKSVAVAAANKTYRHPSEKTNAEVVFRCAGEYCALAAIYRLHSPTGDVVPVRLKAGPVKSKQLVEVRIPASE